MSKKILIIEDDEDILEMLCYLLQDAGYELITSKDGKIVSDIKTIKPDLIICDVWVPSLKGTELCKKVKADTETKDVPFILISTAMNLPKLAMQCGADTYIQKPFQLNEMLATVESYMSDK